LAKNFPTRKLLLFLLPLILVAQHIDAHAQTAKLPRVEAGNLERSIGVSLLLIDALENF